MIRPYDLGENKLVEDTQRIEIDSFVRQINKELKVRLLEAKLEALGVSIELTTSRTRFNGSRLWFLCPCCRKRSGILYNLSMKLACRVCLGLLYRKQRYKGMIESHTQVTKVK